MLIDFKTGKVIEQEKGITISQTLTKYKNPIINSEFISEDISPEKWNEILHNNALITPYELLGHFLVVLDALKKGQSLDPKYLAALEEQCQDWEISDSNCIIE